MLFISHKCKDFLMKGKLTIRNRKSQHLESHSVERYDQQKKHSSIIPDQPSESILTP